VTLIIFTGGFSFLTAPKYKATTTLLLEEEGSKMLSIEDEFGFRQQISDLRFFNTQVRLLKSKSLAERVVKKMNLLSRPELSGGDKPEKNTVASLKDFLTFKWLTSDNGQAAPNPDIPGSTDIKDPYWAVVERIQASLKVSPIRDTRLVELSFTSSSPELAAEMANNFAQEFMSFSVEKRYQATQRASEFLSKQIEELRNGLAEKEKELQKYSQEKEIYFLNNDESTAVSKFADVNKAYTQAQIDRIKAESAYRELENLDVDSLPQFVNNHMIQELKTEYTRIKNEYEEKSKTFKPSYPQMQSLKARLDSMKDELGSEIRKAVKATKSDYESALQRERSLENLLEEERRNVAKMNSNAILYNSLKIEVENKRKLLNSLVERQNQTVVSSGLSGIKASNISIVDEARVPQNPVSPKKKLNLFLALLLGLFGGVGLCFVVEYFDNTIKEPEDVERLTGLPSLGLIPLFSTKKNNHEQNVYFSGYKNAYSNPDKNILKEVDYSEIKNVELINHFYPQLSIAEDYRTVRSSILLSQAENLPQIIMLTSALPQEGKTSATANMAVAFSQLDQRVLVVDADLRKPRLHKIFKVRNTNGLSGYLVGKFSMKEVVQKTEIPNVWILPSGLIPPDPTELLNSNRMSELVEELKKEFDIILIDSPPVLAAIDSAILTKNTEKILMVLEAEKTPRKDFSRAVEELNKKHSKIMGVLFNRVKMRREDYNYMNYYRYNHYSS
ncbi:MAG: GumC family protein, partial [Acidobacteriota bacterium]